MDLDHKNKLKKEFYQLFFKILDTEIIDSVLQQCNYNGHQTYEQLALLSGQRPVQIEPTAPPISQKAGQSYPQQPGQPYPQQPGQPYPQQPSQSYPQQPGQSNPQQPGQPYPQQPGQPRPQQHGPPHPRQPGQPYPQQPGQPYPQQPSQSYPQQPGQPCPQQSGQSNPQQPGQPYFQQPGQPHPQQPGQPYPQTERSQQPHLYANNGTTGGQNQPPLQPRFVPKQLYPSLQPQLMPDERPVPEARAATQPERRAALLQERKQEPARNPQQPVAAPRKSVSAREEDRETALLSLAIKLELLRVIVQHEADQKKKESQAPPRELKMDERGFPKHWPHNDRSVNIIPVTGLRFEAIQKIFHDLKTGMQPIKMTVCSVDEVCNMKVYEEYILQKHCLVNDTKDPNERNLWYPSRDQYVEEICHKGIDFTTDLSDGPIGTGKYLFTNATEAHGKKAAHRYQKNTFAYMFLCNVLAGDMKKTGPDCNKAPLHGDGRSYDCSVDSILKPDLYIVHNKMNCYPRYLITYTVEE